MKTQFILAFGLALVACSGGDDQASSGGAGASSEALTPANPATAAIDKARAALGQCIACHKLEKGSANGLGPGLWGIHGAKAGSVAGFNYSAAVKDSGLTWDDATLDKYIENPRAFVPGNRMAYAGQKDAAKRAEMIAALKSLKD